MEDSSSSEKRGVNFDMDANDEVQQSQQPTSSNTQRKSCLKKPTQVVDDDSSGSEFDFSLTRLSEDEEEDESNLADDSPQHFVHNVDNYDYADFRRLFSLPESERNSALESRKDSLGSFVPPKKPTAKTASIRYEQTQKQWKKWSKLAWDGSASAGSHNQFMAMRQKVNTEELVRKYNPPPTAASSSQSVASSSRPQKKRKGETLQTKRSKGKKKRDEAS